MSENIIKTSKCFFFMNLSEAFNNKQGPPGIFFKTRIYFVSHRQAFTAASTRLEFFSSLIWSFFRLYSCSISTFAKRRNSVKTWNPVYGLSLIINIVPLIGSSLKTYNRSFTCKSSKRSYYTVHFNNIYSCIGFFKIR